MLEMELAASAGPATFTVPTAPGPKVALKPNFVMQNGESLRRSLPLPFRVSGRLIKDNALLFTVLLALGLTCCHWVFNARVRHLQFPSG